MARFRVWAPNARQVELAAGTERTPMHREARGWWYLDHGCGGEYAFALDGDGPLPDPRSPWQPSGVHGPSCFVDHEAFRWSDDVWQPRPLAAGLVYELHIGTFTPEGTFDSAIERLPQLAGLGVTHLEIMPVVEFPGNRGWGYDGVSLFAPHHGYGGPAGFKRLVDACHRHGLAVILDVVYNHLGPSGNYLPRFGPYFTGRHHTPWGSGLNFDGAGSAEVRRFYLDNAAMWLRDYHVDGLRVDAVHAMMDTSALHFLEDLALHVDALEIELGRHLILTAESDLNDPRIVRERAAGGYGFDAQWNDDFHHALHTLLTGERSGYYADFAGMQHLARTLENIFVYEGGYSQFRDRPHGRPARGLPASRFLGYMQNHDQIGNRALGERSAALLPRGRLYIAAAVVLTSPFVPMLFQGEEWGASTPFLYFTDHTDPDLARAVSEGRRREFPHWLPADVPDPQDPATFERSKLNWAERELAPHRDLLAWHADLIRLRNAVPEIRHAPVSVRYDERRGSFVIHRGPIRVACNLAAEEVLLEDAGSACMVLASHRDVRLGAGVLRLPPDSVAVTGAADRPDIRGYLERRAASAGAGGSAIAPHTGSSGGAKSQPAGA